ncbi:MAG: LPXTG cell wall anchor domain-containing protein [Thermoleophilia bacterium]
MKLKVALILMISIMVALGLAGIAVAQAPCNPSGEVTFTPGSAQPGGTDTVCGSTLAGGTDVTVNFDGTAVGSGVVDQYGFYCVTFTVPADATAGTHVIEISIHQGEFNCQLDFVVEAAAIAPADKAPREEPLPARLPSTGIMLFPAGGLLAGGLGMLLFRKRRR